MGRISGLYRENMRIKSTCIVLLLIAAGMQSGIAGSAEQPTHVPVTVTADKLDYDRTNDRYVATGHVKIEKEGIRIEADSVVMDNKTG